MNLGVTQPWRAWSQRSRIPRFYWSSSAAIVPFTGHQRAFFHAGHSKLAESTSKPADNAPLRAHASAKASATKNAQNLVSQLETLPYQPHGTIPVTVDYLGSNPDWGSRRKQASKHHAALKAARFIDERHKRKPDWRLILETLQKQTPVLEHDIRVVKVRIPVDGFQHLLTDFHDNFWDICSRTGCQMRLYTTTSRKRRGPVPSAWENGLKGLSWNPTSEKFILIFGGLDDVTEAYKGIARAVKGTIIVGVRSENDWKDFLRLAGRVEQEMALRLEDAKKGETNTTEKQYRKPISRPRELTRFHETHTEPYRLAVRADQIPALRDGEVWTKATFLRYIRHLVCGELAPGEKRVLYENSRDQQLTHADVVVRQLRLAFYDEACANSVSLPALKDALRYLAQSPHGSRFTHVPGELVRRVKSLGLRVDADVFNWVAQVAVNSKHLRAFQGTLSTMAQEGHAPNFKTWFLFLRLIKAEDVRRYILRAMNTKGYLTDPKCMRRIYSEMAGHDLHRALELRQDFQTFLQRQRDLYGPDWRLTLWMGNILIHKYGTSGRLKNVFQVLEAMIAAEEDPDIVTLNTIISHCRNQRKLSLAMSTLEFFSKYNLAQPDGITYRLLFSMALTSRRLHLTTYIVRHAILAGCDSHLMRSRVAALLKANSRDFTEYLGFSTVPEKWANASRFVRSKRHLAKILSLEKSLIKKGVPRVKRWKLWLNKVSVKACRSRPDIYKRLFLFDFRRHDYWKLRTSARPTNEIRSFWDWSRKAHLSLKPRFSLWDAIRRATAKDEAMFKAARKNRWYIIEGRESMAVPRAKSEIIDSDESHVKNDEPEQIQRPKPLAARRERQKRRNALRLKMRPSRQEQPKKRELKKKELKKKKRQKPPAVRIARAKRRATLRKEMKL
ncbi:hypothetical protein B0T21DRAFT_359514 [Apiosordaria backusii]|uniref:Pentatricopeptide repeat domain-containing protein n=1 Tax=Apiosordaria backusii TaxID=314023 RepID=A0AA40ETN7_9PEZI|nr:hypothetical protein B0T21DRAFT_359514 [Apiosordaria backusii]